MKLGGMVIYFLSTKGIPLFFVLMARWRYILIGSFIFSFYSGLISQNQFWICENGFVSFASKAPLEMIQAESRHVRGIMSPASKSFAFSLNINSFEGFNSDVQQTHFLENYLEGKKYPQATFTGKLIEDVPFDKPGTYSVRAKGNLNIHGITKERIIRGTLTVKNDGGQIDTDFSIPVSDHGITIPKIVQQKISDDIQVKVRMDFSLGQQP
jgi:hypothetical protein